MGSSGESSSGGGYQPPGAPAPGLPVAGAAGGAAADPYSYGKFQNFLPEVTGEGPNPMAKGLTPDMFDYKPPGAGGGGAGMTLPPVGGGGPPNNAGTFAPDTGQQAAMAKAMGGFNDLRGLLASIRASGQGVPTGGWGGKTFGPKPPGAP